MTYFKSLDSIQEMESTPVGVSFSSLEYSEDSLLKNIIAGNFSKTKIKSIIAANPNVYFNHDNFSHPKTRSDFQKLWTNIKFLEAVCALLDTNDAIRSLVYSTYIRDVNKIVYDYHCTIESPDIEKDRVVDNILKDIANIINAPTVIQLNSRITRTTACIITNFYYSSFDKDESAERLSDVLYWTYLQEIEHYDVETLVFIYHIFFSNEFSYLFNSVMTTKRINDQNKKIVEINNMISSAILSILNSMSSEEITKVLMQYSGFLTLTNVKKVRFSLKNLSQSFGRVAKIVKELNENGYIIP